MKLFVTAILMHQNSTIAFHIIKSIESRMSLVSQTKKLAIILNHLLKEASPKKQIYCYWDARSTFDSIIVIANILITSIIFVIAVLNLIKAMKQLEKGILVIYSLSVSWAFLYLMKDIFSVSSFFAVLSDIPQRQTITTYSKVYSVANALPAIIVQTLFIVIPYIMCGGVMNNITEREGKVPKFEFTIYKLIKKYFFIRVYLAVPLIMILVETQAQTIGDFCTLKLALQLFDTLICCLILLFALWVFDRHKSYLPLKIRQRKQLKRQLILLLACSVSRFVGNIFFLIIMPYIVEQSRYTDCIEPANEHIVYTFGYLLIGSYLMHFVPVYTICKVYKPDQPQMYLSKYFVVNSSGIPILQEDNQQQ